MKKKILNVCFIILVIFIVSCQKVSNLTTNQVTVNHSSTKDGIPCYPFSWETANFMPTPAGTPAILVPWASGSNQQFPNDIALDFASSDGWSLVYNTFNTSALSSPYFFTLYNQYSGLLRFYFYLPPNTPVPSSYLNHSLSTGGSLSANSSMLNYIAQDVTDFSTNLTTNTQVQNYQIVATGAWYVCQYEIAYDPSIATTDWSNLNMTCAAQSINVTQLSINGTVNGTVKTAVSEPNSSSQINLTGAATQAGKGAVAFLGYSALGSTNNTGLSTDLYNALKSTLKGDFTGAVTGVLNAIFGGSSSNSQNLNLTLNAQLALTGTATNNTALWNPTLIIPGTVNSQNGIGYIPNYNSPLGVFNVSAKPVVNVTVTNTYGMDNGGLDGGGTTIDNSSTNYTFNVDNSSFQTLINPVVSSSATVSIHSEAVLLHPPGNIQAYEAQIENVGGNTVYGGLGYIVTGYDGDGLAPLLNNNVAVRLTVTVTPNNGAPPSKIVKTFYANANVTIVN